VGCRRRPSSQVMSGPAASAENRARGCATPLTRPPHRGGLARWWSHLHASEVGASWEELLEGPSPEEVARAVERLREQQRQGREPGQGSVRQQEEPAIGGGACEAAMGPGDGASAARSASSGEGEALRRDGGDDEGGGAGAGGVVPRDVWHARLAALLAAHPGAVVGEVGLDRSAVIPGTRARVRFDHQIALLREQLALAAREGRPVSVHCVRAYGHLLALFEGLAAGGGAACPPAVMLHSYGGSPEDVARFARLPAVGRRFYFSFSAAINGRTPGKLAARVAAVPADRLLVESDQARPLGGGAGKGAPKLRRGASTEGRAGAGTRVCAASSDRPRHAAPTACAIQRPPPPPPTTPQR
jgi:hypothetical protein